jgi:cytosine/adenosine deaminase-related metal-dependent hydrolase
MVLTGRVVAMDDAATVLDDGALWIGDDGRIEQVAPRRAAAPAGFDGAPVVRTGGTIYPGLIDLHNHLAYNCVGLWIAPRDEPYTSRDQWPREDEYVTDIRQPAAALGQVAGRAVLKWVELKALVGGVTAIQGSAKLDRPYEGWLVRNVELETFGTGRKTINQSVRTLAEPDFAPVRERMAGGNAFLYHLSEGTDDGLLAEYRDLAEHDCLMPQFVGIHSTALGEPEFREWGRRGGSIVWSPFSNLWLYRDTTDVATASEAGLNVCLGADWAPSGSKHLLGELKVADLHNRETFGGHFGAEALVRMATSNPADAVGWSEEAGRLVAGTFADVLVVAGDGGDPYRALIEATEPDVRLVVVGGRPLYGTPGLMRAAGAARAEPLTVAGARRVVDLVDPRAGDRDLRYADVVARLREARRDPVAAASRVERSLEPEVRVELDMPWDEVAERAPLDLARVRIGPIDSLAHDRRFFAAIDRARGHGGRLDGLKEYYG